MSETDQNQIGANFGHQQLLTSSDRNQNLIPICVIVLLLTSIYLMCTIPLRTYALILPLLLVSGLAGYYQIELAINTKTTLFVSLILHLSIIALVLVLSDSFQPLMICAFLTWYLSAIGTSVCLGLNGNRKNSNQAAQ